MSQAIASARPAPTAAPGRRRNGRLAHRDQRAGQQALPLLQVGDPLVMRHCELGLVAVGAHALDVAAGAERRAGAGQQQRADFRILAAGLDHVAQGRRQIIRHRVARLGAVQRDDGDAVADHAQQFVGAGIDLGLGHGSPSYCCSCHSGVGKGRATQEVRAFRWWARFALPGLRQSKTSRPTAAVPVPRSRRCAAVAAHSSSSAQWRRDRASSPACRQVRSAPRCGCRRR